ncbi:MAG TPA: carboxylesterase/lipase family protein [Bryobacteraceae bacterium]|nr:carboxylesterase/lipase family protein [Bryobacteraceae bacterium]
MFRLTLRTALGPVLLLAAAAATYGALPAQIQTQSGAVEGMPSADGKVQVFEGIPFAAPPVGKLRWQAPQPAAAWEGVRKATTFGARCMQAPIYSDMIFRDSGPSEDCLYLNVWTPATSASAKLPVMVWIYGGGFAAGASSEPRQDGSKLAEKGVVVVSMNYRLGIFGFFAHPELTKESPQHASGNYGLMDQAAALDWVHKNIAAFGGDPDKVTIFGESAGSISVCAQMASPLSKNLIKGAIGESGSLFMLIAPTMPLEETERQGSRFATAVGAADLDALRAMPAKELLDTAQQHRADFRFWPNVDGYFLPESPKEIFAQGKQAHVALLAGWNTDEQSAAAFFGKEPQTIENYTAKIKTLYGEHAQDMLKLYPAVTEMEMKESAGALAGDRFIAYSTWKWLDEQLKTGDSDVYRYHFEQAPPQPEGKPSRGAYHSADIEYVFETLDSKDLPWTNADRKLSDMISSYWTNFAKKGDPNGAGLPKWPKNTKKNGYELMHLVQSTSVTPHAAKDTVRPRYQMLEKIAEGQANGGAAGSSNR